MFRTLLPKDEKYFSLLTKMAARVIDGGKLFTQIFDDYANHAEYAEKIKMVEVDCDSIAASITQKLNSTFITPIDREDIYLLVTELDDVIDMINGLARRFDIYGVQAPRVEAKEIAGLLLQAIQEIHGAFILMEKDKTVGEHCKTINQIEKQADHLYREAIRKLFVNREDPLEVIRWMAIYDGLEDSVDRCKDVAEALEAVLVKNK